MNRRRVVYGVVGSALLAAGVMPAAAQASASSPRAACSMLAGSVTSAGAQTTAKVTAGTPPTMSNPTSEAGVFPAGAVRLSSTFESEPNVAGADSSGYVVEGDALYYRMYNFNAGSATGFGSVKAMALISKTAKYDTFLANTRGGALYTIRIPVTSPMKPIVTKIRPGTWQGFESLVAEKCGNYGTLLLGIDKETQTANLYAIGHANGPTTVINSLGKVKATFPNPVNFRWGPVYFADSLNGD
ncbi:hypothetical protein PWY87_06585 [Kribbella solani]|uniref:hypothetical protein n=1 Tax=Kribbella solani TaxID=236067 RepID=UPI0029B5D397|nr:hypothetical protein [Kribbella solani]MDX2968913.1 hypothetical protein [Kribbella solani]MDX3001326.1 hypothetical protein [Kribbella solani]